MINDAYLGNPNLKKSGTKTEFTEEQVNEFQKCSEDPIYFIKNFVKIVSLDEGLVPFTTYKFQDKMIDTMHSERFSIYKLPRQSGKSTTIISYLLHYALFNPNSSIAILANKSSTARDIFCQSVFEYAHGKFKIVAISTELHSKEFALSSHDQADWVPIVDLLSYKLLPADIPIAEKLVEQHQNEVS